MISHASADAVVAYRAGKPVRAADFLADVRRVAQTLPAGAHFLNACSDRYRFTVAFAAGLVAGKASLLPSTHTAEVIRQLREFAPNAFCVTDDPQCGIDLPQMRYPEAAPDEVAWDPIEVDANQTAAFVFTSGSTGTPIPYRKTWGRLVSCVRIEAERLGLLDAPHAVVATVPPQHMYGFESSVLLALQSGNAFTSGKPFFPADIGSELAAVPRPRMLVTTPVHLRTMLGSGVPIPPVEIILSATAPLSQNLAREVEATCATRLLEIYGSTETGQIASRRTAQNVAWELFSGVTLSADGERTWAQGGHVEQRTAMCDVLEITGPEHFLLHGRLSDLVNIAGKRSSLSYLNHQLNAIPGIVDGVFFIREDRDHAVADITRVAALVVAPDLDAAAITEALRKRLDPVFLPRPLLLVAALPRTATGKLPREAVQALAAATMKASR